MHYRGRFAPSPTGPLHFGSLASAVASYLDARHHGGDWLVRIENVDKPRERGGSADTILRTLELFGMQWDETPVRQTDRIDAYTAALSQLTAQHRAYACSCSRKKIANTGASGIEGPIYSGNCRQGHQQHAEQLSYRLKATDEEIYFQDRIQGKRHQNVLHDIGDFVIRRADGLFAYQLAVVVDDAWQNITHIVRGRDLLISTPRQILLQQMLDYTTPAYAHHPLVKDQNGNKLSKSDNAWAVDTRKPLATLNRVLVFLNQAKVESDTIEEFWKQAITAWDVSQVHHE